MNKFLATIILLLLFLFTSCKTVKYNVYSFSYKNGHRVFLVKEKASYWIYATYDNCLGEYHKGSIIDKEFGFVFKEEYDNNNCLNSPKILNEWKSQTNSEQYSLVSIKGYFCNSIIDGYELFNGDSLTYSFPFDSVSYLKLTKNNCYTIVINEITCRENRTANFCIGNSDTTIIKLNYFKNFSMFNFDYSATNLSFIERNDTIFDNFGVVSFVKLKNKKQQKEILKNIGIIENLNCLQTRVCFD